MQNKPDINTREDINVFIRAFYQKVIRDETIGIIFTDIVRMDWEKHIPLIIDFWESILLDNPVYKNNAMEVHYHLNNIFALEKKHFEAWLFLFNSTIESLYEGPVTELAKKRASGIAAVMEFKMTNTR